MHTADTAQAGQSRGERTWVNESKGPVTTWEEFETYPWPEPGNLDTSPIEWMDRNLPDDMCLTTGCHSIFEQMFWLMGIEGLSYALVDAPKLVEAVADKAGEIYLAAAKVFVQFDRIRLLFGGDDMGFKTTTLVSPQTLRELVLPWHKKITRVAHDAGRLNILHSCGKIEALMPDLIEDVAIDGRHSFEDAIEPVTTVYRRWGSRIAVLGGVDVDFLCRSPEQDIRRRVREILEVCHPGRYALGTGNSVANYIPLDSYLVMLDEGRRYTS
jgi:uroporphyrinogen decarboxylase